MNEELSPESPEIKREQVAEAFKKFIDQGITNPDELQFGEDPNIPENILFDVWIRQEERKVNRENLQESLEFDFMRTTIMIDLRFSHPDYLDLVANDWLSQDLDSARQAGLDDLAKRIQDRIDELNHRIGQQS